MKNVLMIVHTFPPMGSVGGSIRIVKFLKYINELREDIYSTVVTIRKDIVLLNDLHLSESSLAEIPKKNISIIRTNTLQPRHPYPEKFNKGEKSLSEEKTKLSPINFKKIIKKIYYLVERFILIPDYAILWTPSLIRQIVKDLKHVDLIYATAPPFSVLINSVITKKIIKKKLIMDIKDDWIHQTRLKTQPFFLKKLEERMEKYCIRNADKVILVTQSSYEDFNRRYPRYKNKFELIYNGCDIDEYRKFWDGPPKFNKKFSMVHSGVIANSRNPKALFDSLSILKSEGFISCENFELKFTGRLSEEIMNLIRERDINDIIITTPVLDRENYIRTIINADLLLAINYQIKTLIPGKLYDYWGSRRPVLLLDSPDSTAAKFVNENSLGRVIDFSDTEGIVEGLKHYLNLWKTNGFVDNISIDNLHHYDRKLLTEKLLRIFDTV